MSTETFREFISDDKIAIHYSDNTIEYVDAPKPPKNTQVDEEHDPAMQSGHTFKEETQ